METTGKDSCSLAQPIPEIRIRKGSDVPSISESEAEAEREGYAPLACDEGLSDLDENIGDAENARVLTGVISPTLQLDLSSPDDPPAVWNDGDKDAESGSENVQDKPRPPRPATTPTKPPPPRPPQMKSPDLKKGPPSRPAQPPKSPVKTPPSGGIQVHSVNQLEEDFGMTPSIDKVDYSAGAQDVETKPTEPPFGTSPIGYTSRDTDSPPPANADQEKIKITLPKSAKAKSSKKQFNASTQDGQTEAERVLTPPPGKKHAPAPPPPPSIVKTRPARPPLPPPPSKAAPEPAAPPAEPVTKSTWEVFDDAPSFEEKTTEDEASEAAATITDDDTNDPFAAKPPEGGDSTSHPTNSFDDESKLCDPASPTEKKSHKYKGIGTKRLRGFLDPKKGKNTTKKEKKHRVKDKELFSKFLTDESKDTNEKSPEFLAFQQMQDRIKQTVEASQEKLSKHKMEFEDELHKLATSADNSPWFIVPPDGQAPVEEEVKKDEKPDPRALWDGFDDDFEAVPNAEIAKNVQETSASPSPNPVPPYNSRCASNEQLSEMATTNGEADLLGLNQGEATVEQTDGLGSGLDRITGRETLNADILSLSRNPVESNKSSGRSSPSALEADMAALGIITEDAPDAPEIGSSLVDDFLGISSDAKSANNAVTSTGNVMDILGFDDKDVMHEEQPATTSNHGNLLGGTTPTEPQGGQTPGVALLVSSADDKASAFSASISNDDIFGLGAKKETELTTVKSGENLFSFGEDAFDTEKYKQPDIGGATNDASALQNDEFDPRADFDNLDAKPITDENMDMWGSSTVTKPKNPFTSESAEEQATTVSSSANPFATKNPFLSSDANAGDDIPFADGDGGVNIFDDKTPSTEVGGFNPFATITDDSAAVDESAFDPFQTIHDDDAFEVHFPDETETETAEKKEDDGAKSPPRFNPFNKDEPVQEKFADFKPAVAEETSHSTTEYSTEEEDENAEPFQPFHEKFEEAGWKMLQRQPTKKKLTQNRYWKEVYVKLVTLNDVPLIKVFKNEECKECIHELGLQYSYTLCNLGLQQFDQYGKCHTVKIQYVFYRERVGVRGERLAPTFSDLTRVRDFKGLRDLVHKPKATMILDHVPQASELIKFGGLSYKDFCSFIWEIEDALFHLPAPREKPLTYTKDEITVDIVDEFVLHLDKDGHIGFNKARVRIFCLAFLTGDKPTVEIGINDKWRQGKEVVRRQDIIPIKTDEWIRIYEPEFHSCVQMDEYEKTHVIQLLPPDACHFEVMRFRVRPRLNKELPLQIHCSMSVVDRHVEMRAEILIPGYYSNSRKASQTPCEDIQVRFPIPDPWIYMFRVEKRFRYGSVRSTTRKPGKIKGLERLTMMAQGMLPSSLIEVSSGVAKYEHVYHNIIWRINRLPERNEGAYKTHMFTMKLDLGPHDTVPESYDKDVFVEYAMPNSTVSRAQVRSISIDTDTSPDKWVHHLAKYEYKVEMEFTDKPFTELCPEKDMMLPVTLEGKEKPKPPTEEATRRASLAEKEDDDSDSSSTDSD